ncbi:hypothetical protein HK101_005550, partial [Irineochytrium annulatum]
GYMGHTANVQYGNAQYVDEHAMNTMNAMNMGGGAGVGGGGEWEEERMLRSGQYVDSPHASMDDSRQDKRKPYPVDGPPRQRLDREPDESGGYEQPPAKRAPHSPNTADAPRRGSVAASHTRSSIDDHADRHPRRDKSPPSRSLSRDQRPRDKERRSISPAAYRGTGRSERERYDRERDRMRDSRRDPRVASRGHERESRAVIEIVEREGRDREREAKERDDRYRDRDRTERRGSGHERDRDRELDRDSRRAASNYRDPPRRRNSDFERIPSPEQRAPLSDDEDRPHDRSRSRERAPLSAALSNGGDNLDVALGNSLAPESTSGSRRRRHRDSDSDDSELKERPPGALGAGDAGAEDTARRKKRRHRRADEGGEDDEERRKRKKKKSSSSSGKRRHKSRDGEAGAPAADGVML